MQQQVVSNVWEDGLHHSMLSLKTSIRLACKKVASAGTLMMSGPATSLQQREACMLYRTLRRLRNDASCEPVGKWQPPGMVHLRSLAMGSTSSHHPQLGRFWAMPT